MNLRYILPVLLGIILAACSSPEHRLLKQADSVIIDHPDSAMAILNTIDPDRLGKRDLPYYALLYTQAQFETGIRPASDSLIMIAYEKYATDITDDKGIRANFYLGESNYDANASINPKTYIKGFKEAEFGGGKSMRHFLKAYEAAKRQGNDYWRARTAKGIKNHFCWIENYYEGERYAREAAYYFKKAGRKHDYRVEFVDHASLYEHLEKFDLEYEELDSMRTVLLNEHPIDSLLIIRINYYLSRMSTSIEILKKRGYSIFSEEDIEGLKGLSDSEIYEKCPGLFGFSACYMLPHKYDRDIIMEITETQRDFYDEISTENAENAAMFRRIIWIAVIVFLTIIAIICMMFYFRNKAQKARIASDMESFLALKADSDRMTREIEEKAHAISNLEHELEEREHLESSNNQIVRDLLADKWSTIGMLCDQLFDVGQSDAERQRVLRNIEKELKKVASPRGVVETVEAVDRHMDGRITRLRKQCPFLKEDDVNFLGLIFAGFSVRTICMFTGMEYKHFYVKKSRLLKRIQTSDAPDRDLFIELIQRK